MIKKIVTIALSVAFPLIIIAQDKIETDRPTETQNAGVVPKGTFQGEVGFRKEQQSAQEYRYIYPNAVFRYGLFKGVELRAATPFETEMAQNQKKSSYGLEPPEVGLKARLYQSKDTTFVLSFYGHLGLPHVASKDYELEKTFYRIRLLLLNKITDKIKINYNLGRDWNNEDMQQDWMYSVSPQFELSDKWQVLLEEYATFQPKESPEHYLDAGVAYRISDNIQADINAGKGLTSKALEYFITIGLSFKL